MSHLERSAEELLENWGRWAVLGSGVASCASRENATLDAVITDDEALVIDRLIGRLCQRYPECGAVLMKYYMARDLSLRDAGHKLGFKEEKTRQLWKAGVAWVDGALEVRREAA
ncbi:antiterminator Q family protein [Pseudomonas entomophila]|uniref:antiterminator Q family protein n=1 Tax=Pseudomonas entomophila TaxID=312306 RepID=UPI0023D7C4FD|nr:antiterminator Q family protein [Pseudomonas entomophila]MDF0731036.1 antiterminator Q family protein [Pseudomonas entomophila]